MYNYFMLIGRLVKDPEKKEFKDGKKAVSVRLAVKRAFKNTSGTYDVDFFNVTFWEFLVDVITESLKKGQMVAVKGRIGTTTEELASGFPLAYPNLIGERIMFLDQYKEENAEP